MPTFVHPLWGYAIDYPEGWAHRDEGEVVAFAARPEALDPEYEGEGMGYLLIRPELNPFLRPIEPLWTEYITKIAIMRGAKKLGASPLKVGNLQGYEAELLLPAKLNRRLWVGLLAAGGVILHLMVTHRKDDRALFQEPASKMVKSLRFVERVEGVKLSPRGLPLPADYQPASPTEVVEGVDDPAQWEAFTGKAPIAALQVFYLREAPLHGWKIAEYYPYPNPYTPAPMARLRLEKDDQTAAVGLIPREEGRQTDVAVKYA
ncbi:MAG: hypothetical protein GXO56_03455 [Chloroflexi bacterium]|nr:hypothetical protein [Chloroflexota bacterium]